MSETDVDDVNEAEEKQPAGVEAVARQLGWKPESEWKGDKPAEGLMSAEDYIVRQYKQTSREARELKREMASAREALQGLSTLQQKAYDRARKDIEAERARAVEEGDNAAHARANERLQELDAERRQIASQNEPQIDPEFKAWLSDNDWYEAPSTNLDLKRAAFADGIVATVARTTGLQGNALRDEVKKRAFEEYPDQNTQRRQRASPVESGGRRSNGGGKTWSDIPDEERAMAEKVLKQKIPIRRSDGTTSPMTREDFVKSYWERNNV